LHAAKLGDTVRRIAREGDPDRAIAALFAPRESRADLLALIAFNVELARIAEQVSEPDLGAIRLQWWREAVERAGDGEPTGQPVADALGEALRRRKLSRQRIDAMIDARAFDLGTGIMSDKAALETYLRDTAGSLFALSAECLGASRSSIEPAAAQAGLAYGLTGLMRALPVHAARRRVDLPADALRARGTSPEEILAGKTSQGLHEVLAELRKDARVALGEASGLAAKLDPPAQAAFLPLCLVEPYLAALAKGRDPLHERAGINPLYRLWRMATWD
jgi:phytoene synthase